MINIIYKLTFIIFCLLIILFIILFIKKKSSYINISNSLPLKSRKVNNLNKKYINYPDIKISLCIPTMNRFDKFLYENLKIYIEYLNKNIIDEIIITDENGNDYEKIKKNFGNIDKLYVYKNNTTLGAFKNKLKVCSYANNNFIALIDSDNFCDENYFKIAKKYIKNNNILNYTILSPSFAIPNFDYTQFNNLIITKNNIKKYRNISNFETLMNTGNYILTKDIIKELKYDIDTNLILSVDVIYFNILLFQQFPKFKFHVLEDLEYTHSVHDDSYYINTNDKCKSFYDNIIMPIYNSL